MDQSQVVQIMTDGVYTILSVAGPMLIVAMVVGLIISIFQATTQINEQTLAFVPKIVAILLVLVLAGGYMLTQITDFVTRMYDNINTMLK